MTGYNITQNRMTAGRAIISVLALWLAFSGVAAAEQLYVNESGWWRDGGAFNASTAPIQAAVDNATAGDSVFVWNGSYSENVDVDKRLTLEGEGADVVTVRSSSDHIFNITADCVNISGFTVTSAIYYSQRVEVCGGGGGGSCPAPGCWQGSGIFLSSVGHCSLTNINASGNRCGIYMVYSNNNTLQNNTANSNTFHGIRLFSSSNNTLKNNTISGNRYNFGVYGTSLVHYTQSIDTSNTVDGRPIYYCVDQQDKVIPCDAGFVGVANSTNITVKDLTLTNNAQGVLFAYTENSRIENINTLGNEYGILLTSSDNNNLMNNIVSNNYWYDIYGIRLLYSDNNNLTNNIVSNSTSIGICLDYSSINTLQKNIALNNYHGIRLYSSSSNTLENNTANLNTCGIDLSYSSDNNTLSNNNVSHNQDKGIRLWTSSNNTLTNNLVNSNRWSGINLDSSSNNNITCNWVQNNTQRGFYLSSGSTDNNISYNNIIENGNYNATSGGWEWQFYIDQYNPVEAKHNYWGSGMNNETIDASIHDDEEGGWGEVVFYPFETEPVQCPLSPELPAFNTTDTVIALEIAVGSRPPDLRWDVSGDGSVTSLDALMILQAVAGAIGL